MSGVIGRKELRLNWAALLTDAAQTPVEPVQCHYMRVARPAGRLAWYFPGDWVRVSRLPRNPATAFDMRPAAG